MSRASVRRRVLQIIACAAGVAACVESSGPVAPPVAWVAGDTLTAEQLAHWLVLAQPFPLETGAAVDVARHWQMVMALARAPERAADAVRTAARIADADAIATLRAQRFPDASTRAAVSAGATYDAGELRLIAHVLRRADRATGADERDIQRRTAQSILVELRMGGAWLEANRGNEDEDARAAGGVIGIVAPGELPEPLDSVAFALAPGAISDVVESAAGFHILYRPMFTDARSDYVDRLAERLAEAQERDLGAEVAVRRNAGLLPIATLRIGELFVDPLGSLDVTDRLGAFDGGTFTGGGLAFALAELPWDRRRALADAPAGVREAFAGRALIRTVLLAEARALHPPDSIVSHFRLGAQLDSLLRVTRGADARASVDRYMGTIAARHAPMMAISPALWSALLSGRASGFSLEAVGAAARRARVLLDAGGYDRKGAT